MSSAGRGYYSSPRGRGSSRGESVRQQGGGRGGGTGQSITRPYKRRTSGGAAAPPRWETNAAVSKPPRTNNAGKRREEGKRVPSQEVLARAAAIRESASQYVRDGGSSGSEGEEEEEGETGNEVLKNMLKMYYQDLGTDGEGVSARHVPLVHTSCPLVAWPSMTVWLEVDLGTRQPYAGVVGR